LGAVILGVVALIVLAVLVTSGTVQMH